MNTVNQYIPSSIISKQHINALITISIGCIIYLVLDSLSLKHSSALFIGIPYIMSILLSIPHANENMSRDVAVTLLIALIASFVVLNEGTFCVPMTAPLFLIVGLYVTLCIKKIRQKNTNHYLYFLALIAPLILSFEGTSQYFQIERENTISTKQLTKLSSSEILERLGSNRQITELPLLLSYGFPKPVSITGNGNNIDNIREIYFSGGEGLPGIATFKIVKRTQNLVKFQLVNDHSHISHWLEWNSATISWVELVTGETAVTWSIEYTRKLDPAWYFSPLQKIAVETAAETLLKNLVLYEL